MKQYTTTQQNYINEGRNQDMQLREHIRGVLGIDQSLVESKRHTIISATDNVGVSSSIMQEFAAAKVNLLWISYDITDAELVSQLAYGVNRLLPGEQLVVFMNNADNVLFRDYQTVNKFKLLMDSDEPVFAQDVNLANARAQYEKTGHQELVIPMDQVRFVVVCNRNCEDRKQFSSNQMWNAVQGLVDRVKYKRLD